MLENYLNTHKDRFLSELFEWLRIPSISADSNYKGDVLRAAEFLSQKLKDAGADNVEICATEGHPIVYGEKIIGKNLPTVLVYGHYDVQPADPIELWTTPAFEPNVRDGYIYARGSCDDKGQTYMHVKAFEMMMKNSALPCNVKFMIEGEEEVGSKNLETYVKNNVEKLKADIILISDTSIIANDVPSINVGLRGLSYMEVEVTGPNRDLHSGIYGGAVANPINVLCEMITKLKDSNEHITIPHFYDKVVELSANERAEMATTPFDLDDYKAELDLSDIHGEKGYTTLERTSTRPTLDVNGIWGGYTGEGSKTVIASKAYAKISMRLVPNQSAQEISDLFADYFRKLAPPSVKVKVAYHHGGEPYLTSTESVPYQAAKMAFHKTFGKNPIPTRGGGSIPIVAMFKKVLGLESIMMGFGLDSDAIHSPDERYGLFNYYKGIETIPYFFQYYADLVKKEAVPVAANS